MRPCDPPARCGASSARASPIGFCRYLGALMFSTWVQVPVMFPGYE